MVDRTSRDRMMRTIRSYMDEEIASHQFDDMLEEIARTSPDECVREIRRELWFFYDDLKDHLIVASKQNWDCFNRILLLLASNSEIKVEKRWSTWHTRQIIAAAGLVIYACLAFRVRFAREALVLLAFLSCLVSMALAWYNERHPILRRDFALEPFPSISSLRAVRRSVDNFVRKRYPRGLAGRRIRDPETSALMRLPSILMWFVFSPIVLLIQMLPARDARFTISESSPTRK